MEAFGLLTEKTWGQKGVQILKFITFYENALHLTRVHCSTFYQSELYAVHLRTKINDNKNDI